MWTNRFMVAALLGVAGLFAATNPARAGVSVRILLP